MSTPFLMGFSRAVVTRLWQTGELVVADDRGEEVASYVAAYLHQQEGHASLVSTLAKALVACPQVEELFADDERLKQVITDLGR